MVIVIELFVTLVKVYLGFSNFVQTGFPLSFQVISEDLGVVKKVSQALFLHPMLLFSNSIKKSIIFLHIF